MKKIFLLLSLCFLSHVFAWGQFSKETFTTSSGDILPYRKLVPWSIEEGEKYPLVIFLHGAGERGSNNESQLTHGASMFAKNANRKAFPAYVLFPQCPGGVFWSFDVDWPSSFDQSTFPVDAPIAKANGMAKELIDSYLKQDNIDHNRIYIIGISMGAMGTYDLVCRFPGLFAAAVPICGGVNVKRLTGEESPYWRIYHGASDGVVPVSNSKAIYKALTDLNANVEYIEYPGVDHESWKNAFQEEDFLSWIFEKHLKTANAVSGTKENSTKIYQTPNGICVETENVNSTLSLNLYSIAGEKLHSYEKGNLNGVNRQDYVLPNLTKGIYLVEVLIGNARHCLKIYR